MWEKEPLIDKCAGCQKVEGDYCKVYLYPVAKWRAGNCPMATHIPRKATSAEPFVDPLKKSKRSQQVKRA